MFIVTVIVIVRDSNLLLSTWFLQLPAISLTPPHRVEVNGLRVSPVVVLARPLVKVDLHFACRHNM